MKVEHAQPGCDWQAHGVSCGLWVDLSGQARKGYVHDTAELLMVLDEQLELEMQGRPFRPQIGEEVLIPARATSSVRSGGSATARGL